MKKNLREQTSDHAVAVKRLSLPVVTGSPRADEVEMLRILRNDLCNQEHFAIHLAMVFECPQVVHVLSPLADVDLSKFLAEDKYQRHRTGRIECLLQQIQHVAQALEYLHKRLWPHKGEPKGVCCHMDMKPNNILVFGLQENTVGNWKLTDFGVSKVSELKGSGSERARVTITVSTGATVMGNKYQAPEIEFKMTAGRRSDIWALGCICLEAIAAGRGFRNNLERMITVKPNRDGDAHTYFYRPSKLVKIHHSLKGRGHLKKAVGKWIKSGFAGGEELREEQQSILNQAKPLILSMLKPEREKRPNAETVVLKLREILQNARNANQQGA